MSIKRPFVFYVLSLAGHVYAGTHQVRARSDWRPSKGERGNGVLPDGYRGSGTRWLNVVRKHGADAIRWRIVAVLHAPVRDEIDAVERRVIGVVRRMFGKACCNLLEGTVMTSADALVIQNRPEVKAKVSAALNRPDVKVKMSAANKIARKANWQDPEYAAKMSAAQKATNHIRFDVPPAPDNIYDALVAVLRQGKGDDTYQVFIARLALQFPSIPVWQFQEACIESGIPKGQGHANVQRARLVAKLHAEITPAPSNEQAPKAFADYMRALTDSDFSDQEAAFRAALRYPSIDGPTGGRAATTVGFTRGTIRGLVSHVRAITGVIEELASQKSPLPTTHLRVAA